MTTTKSIIAIALALTASTVSAQQGDPRRGEKVFETCRACHAVDGKTNEVGPGLHGMFSRKAGDRDDFRYSPAMKKSGITWNRETLDTFLADPQKAVPANRMPFSGVPDARERADVIAYMMQVFR
jgi:cytochrome c